MANIKFNVQAGLYNDYGIFNLREDTAIRQIYLDFVINGSKYVENDEFVYQHGGTSAYKEFQGIDPLVTNESNWDKYGQTFASILRHYLKNLVNGYTPNGEIYDSEGSDYKYVNYKNQFQLEFRYGSDNTITNVPLEPDNSNIYKKYSGYVYKDYKEQDQNFFGKNLLTVQLSAAQTGIYLTLQAIHFSKYYPLYTVTSGQEKILQPILFTVDDFEKLGFTSDQNNHPAIKDILCLSWHRYHSSSHRWEEMYVHKSSWNGTQYSDVSEMGHYDEKTGGGHDWALFNNSPNGGEAIQSVFNFDGFHNGFILFDTLKHEYSWPWYKINDWGDDAKISDKHTSTFECNGPNYDHFFNDAAFYNTYGSPGYYALGIGFKYDSQHNIHVFNSFIPVDKKTQTIRYKNTEMSNKYPPYLGQVVASMAASIYVYKEVESNNLHYIGDIVYLGKNGTLYTQDIPFRMYVNSDSTNHNGFLIMHGIYYDDYLQKLQGFINHQDEKYGQDITNNNVDLHLQEIVKNSPIQFRLDYTSPDLSTIGLTSYVTLKQPNKPVKRILSDIVNRDKLYQVDEEGNISYLNSALQVKWINTITLNPGQSNLEFTFYEDKPLYNNYEIYKIFNFNNEKLDCNMTSPNSSNQFYNIYSVDGSYGDWLFGLPAEEVFWPEARIV